MLFWPRIDARLPQSVERPLERAYRTGVEPPQDAGSAGLAWANGGLDCRNELPVWFARCGRRRIRAASEHPNPLPADPAADQRLRAAPKEAIQGEDTSHRNERRLRIIRQSIRVYSALELHKLIIESLSYSHQPINSCTTRSECVSSSGGAAQSANEAATLATLAGSSAAELQAAASKQFKWISNDSAGKCIDLQSIVPDKIPITSTGKVSRWYRICEPLSHAN